MPFHVEITSPVSFARALNIDEEALRSAILEPWVTGLPLALGEHRWEPTESRLTILEGPALPLSPSDGEGWAAALRTAEDVTRPMLEAAEASASAQTAVVVEASSLEDALHELREGRPAQRISWVSAVERIEGRDADVAAMILVVKPSRPLPPEL